MLARRVRCAGCCLLLLLCFSLVAPAQDKEKDKPAEKFPSKDEVADLLKREPLTLETWPAWRERLLRWIHDKGQGTDPAFDEGRKFVRAQVNDQGELPEALAKDFLAWYLLSSSYYLDEPKDADRIAEAKKADQALRKSLELKSDFGFAHRRQAQVYMRLDNLNVPTDKGGSHFVLALKALEEAGKHLPADQMVAHRHQAGEHALAKGYSALAEGLLLQVLREVSQAPPEVVQKAASAILANPEKSYQDSAKQVEELIQQYPKIGALECYLAMCQLGSLDLPAAEKSVARAREQGAVVDQVVAATQANIVADNILRNPRRGGDVVQTKIECLRYLAELFPKDGRLVVMHGLGLYLNDEYEAALAEFARARELGTDPATVVIHIRDGSSGELEPFQLSKLVPEIEKGATEARLQRVFLWTVAGFFAFVVGVMGLMTGLGSHQAQSRTTSPSTRPLALALWLFYVVLFVMLVAVVGLNIGVIVLLFSQPRVQLFIVGAITSILFGIALDLSFRTPRRASLGISATGADVARLTALVNEVALRVGAEPVAEVRLAWGAGIALHTDAPRFLGLMGSRRRVLTVGYTALRLLTVGELAAVLTQRFARFRKNDAAADRFLEARSLAIDDSFAGMWAYGGGTNYLNPFFLFLWLYYAAFRRFAAGYRRARTLLADRLAGEQQGGDVTAEALRKLNVDAPLYETQLRELARELIAQDPDLGNMYLAWDDLCGPQATGEDAKEFAHLAVTESQRENARREALAGEAPQADVPPLKQRLDVLADLPKAEQPRNELATELLDNRESWEEQLTTAALESWSKTKAGMTPATAAR
ncbi:MAG: hypothetical protein JNM56_33900 [Planctomycetia bacterium]|nr:hypothetical protein [Planctomycetia bacterium]